MPKVKVARKSTLVDMTAMCDVAFLLLTFFILTSKFRPAEPVQINLPASRAEKKLPEQNVMLVQLSKDGKAFIGLDNQKVRAEWLNRMSEVYPDVKFTPKQMVAFQSAEVIGVPFQLLPKLLDGEIAADKQPGIPVDSTASRYNRCELGDWLTAGRQADYILGDMGKKEIKSDGLSVAVKGDGVTEYPIIKKIMDLLVERKINKFNLVTGSKGNGDGASAPPPPAEGGGH